MVIGARIALLKLSSIGDCVLASPVPKALKAFDPGRKITWVVEERCREIVEANPYVDEIISVRDARPGSLIQAGAELRKRRFDAVLDLQGILKSSILLAMSGAKVRVITGEARKIGRLAATVVAEFDQNWHAAISYLTCAGVLGADTGDARLVAPITDLDRGFAEDFLSNHDADDSLLIGLNPGASREDKRWMPDRFAQVADGLIEAESARVILFGAPGDKKTCDAVREVMRNPVIDAVGKTSLRQLAALAERCALFITNDTGPMHLAAAAGSRVVALFGASNPVETGPYAAGSVFFWKARSWNEAKHRGKHLLNAITAEEVLLECRRQLATADNELAEKTMEDGAFQMRKVSVQCR